MIIDFLAKETKCVPSRKTFFEGIMAQEQFSSLASFVSNNGKICILCREMGIRKTITTMVNELGLSAYVILVTDDFRESKAHKNFINSLEEYKELLLILDFNNENSAVYFHLLDDIYVKYQDKLKAIAIVDKAYHGLISLLYARGTRAVLIKPFMPNDLKSRIMSLFAEASILDRLIEFGKGCLEKQEHGKALAICQKIAAEYEQTHPALLFCGDVHLALGEYRKAGRCYIRGLQDEQLSFQAYASLAKLCSVTKRKRGEIFWLKKFAQINTLDYTNFEKIGDLCLSLNKEDEAKEFFGKSIYAARKITSEDRVSSLIVDIANVCVDHKSVEMSKEYVTIALRNGHVDKTLLSEIAYFRMNKLSDPDGACSIYSLLAVREEKRSTKMDVDFWSTALYNAAICHHIAHGKLKMIKQKNSPKRASDYIFEILSVNPDFGKDDPSINENIISIASNPLQQNNALSALLFKLGRL
ncbi:tetratricopeptide repeat protein [Desulfomicrobium baculatum]|nr:tetratricopeptide repeat protein [Desulfomicrobium baculatum]